MTVTSTNLIQGAAELYTGAFGATEPTMVTSPPGVAYTDLGGTDGGAKLTVDQKYSILAVDQVVDRIGSRITSRDFMVETSLAEPTLENLSVVLNGGTITSATGTKTFEPLFVSSAAQPTYLSLLIDGWAPGQFRRRLIVRKVLSTDKVESSYEKDKQTFMTVQFMGHWVSDSIAPLHVVDATA